LLLELLPRKMPYISGLLTMLLQWTQNQAIVDSCWWGRW